MVELIDRQIAIDAIVEASKVWDTGEPFDEGMKAGYESAVRILLSLDYYWNFCSNCGAKIEVVE